MTDRFTDKKGRPVVAVTGMGLVTSLGWGKADNWVAMKEGHSGITAINRFPTEGLRTTIAGTVTPRSGSFQSAPALSMEMAHFAAEEAMAEAGLDRQSSFPGPLMLATPPAELEWPQRKALLECTNSNNQTGYKRLLAAARTGQFRSFFETFQFSSVADYLCEAIRPKGLPISVSTACASGATAIQLATEAIRRGDTDCALAVGTDSSVQLEALIRFSLLSALSVNNENPEAASRPFCKSRDGFVMAEGAGALVLESLQSATARGATLLGIVRGCGEMADDYHRTRSKPDGSAIIGAIRNALDDADAAPEEIGYVNAHGTSTPENDKMEYLSLKAVLGDHLDVTPVSSTKSMIGHTLSAAGAIEAVLSLMTISNGTLFPTINYDDPDPEIPLDVVANSARPANVRAVLSNSFGFGGQNAALVIGAPE